MNDSSRRPRLYPPLPPVFYKACLRGLTGLLSGLVTGMASGATAADLPSPPKAAAPQEAYVDRVIDGLSIDDSLELQANDYNASGWPRSWQVDYSLFSQRGATSTQSQSFGFSGFLDTPNYGTLSVNASAVEQRLDSFSNRTLGRSSTWRIDQRAVPLDGGWRANVSVGDIYAGTVPMALANGRISIPSTQISGAAGQLYFGDTADINAAIGQAGIFSGVDVSGFERLTGRIASAGGQMKLPFAGLGGRTDVAFQLIDGRDVSSSSSGNGGTQNTQSIWLATGWEGVAPWSSSVRNGFGPISNRQGGLRLQGNIIRSTGSKDGDALGLWADATWRTERWRHSAAVYRFEPLLRWGTSTLASDLQGVYYQADFSTRQWQAGFTSEFSDSVSNRGAGRSGRSTFFSANGRYRLDSRNALGATLSVRALSAPGQAVSLNWLQTNDWGQTQWRGDFANTTQSHTRRLGVDQNWPVPAPATLSTSLALERMTGGQSPGTGLIWGVLGSWSPFSQWSLDSSVRGARRTGGAQSLDANFGLSVQVGYGWRLALRYTEARGKEPLQPLVVSALTSALLPAVIETSTNRSIQLVLSYSGRAGLATAPLGGSPGTGAGALSGNVFFDADVNGRREASEGGVPGVTVILDRRYVTRTDAQGRYEFPFVAAGRHLIELSTDNIPLPWSPVTQEPANVEVLVREKTLYDFPVQRDR